MSILDDLDALKTHLLMIKNGAAILENHEERVSDSDDAVIAADCQWRAEAALALVEKIRHDPAHAFIDPDAGS